jgi:hypothetical protein
MSKTKVTKTVSSKPIGKAVTLKKTSTVQATEEQKVPLTDKQLDQRQKAKGSKRKAQGPKRKLPDITIKKTTVIRNMDVPPTEVK